MRFVAAQPGKACSTVNLAQLFSDVSGYVETCVEPAQARHLVDRAVRVASAVWAR